MTPRVKPQQNVLFIALTTLALLPMTSFAQSKPIMITDLFTNISPTEPWRKGRLTATKTVNFQQSLSGGTDATTVAKVQLGYFTSADCTGALAGTGFYTTPNGTSFNISVGSPFGLVAASTWNVGVNQLGISTGDMANIQSVAVTLKSTNSDVPQSNFSNNSFACVAVTCATNACTSAAGTQIFQLKITAAVGDPADGGVIADVVGLIATASDAGSYEWGGNGTTTTARSFTDGAENTSTIVTTLGTSSNYAALVCNELSIRGGYTTGWFLPALDQLSALYTNQANIGGFTTGRYWSSTEQNSTKAYFQRFNNGSRFSDDKYFAFRVRCVRAFTP
ncbi:MAG: hypothetical protein P1U32_01840 [Legionellaceae bacterium]|nr:hypothetical protein [Legionellaceae bacterium]